jgi:hypothetical protein
MNVLKDRSKFIKTTMQDPNLIKVFKDDKLRMKEAEYIWSRRAEILKILNQPNNNE